jgi:DNA (cytosine-5)-methyltransferase 3A
MIKENINVLSLFDGISGGQQALDRLQIPCNYYSSEIDKYAMSITKKNYPNTVFLGSVVDINIEDLPHIDLLLGGSPCQGFSFSGKQKGAVTTTNIEIITLEQYLQLKENGFEFQGQSYLFWEYIRIYRGLKKKNPKIKFLLENVKMAKKWEKMFNEAVGCEPIKINSELFSAQRRPRLYWTNVTQSNKLVDKNISLQDILLKDVEEKYYLSDKASIYITRDDRLMKKLTAINGEKALCLMRQYNISKNGTFLCVDANGNMNEHKTGTLLKRYHKGIENFGTSPFIAELLGDVNIKFRKLTPVECERLQTVKDNYTAFGIDVHGKEVKISDTQRYMGLGNGWTIDVIVFLLQDL